MDPLMLAAEFWWIAPTLVGAGAVTAVGVRRRSSTSGRRLAFDAARHDVKEAQHEVNERRRAVKLARADHARLVAERSAFRSTTADVSSARRLLKKAEQDAKAATADLRARRVHLSVARAEIPAASQTERFPVARLRRAHDAVTARWMAYETDPARLIAYPAMSDSKEPATAVFLRASRHAQELRPTVGARISPTEFAGYRDAVAQLERAFDVAEHTAKARANGVDPNASGWQDAAQQAFHRSADTFDRVTGAAASVFASWNTRRHPEDETADQSSTSKPAPKAAPKPAPTNSWPVPRRDDL